MNLLARLRRINASLRPPVADEDAEFLTRWRQRLALGHPEFALAPLPPDLAAACFEYACRLLRAGSGAFSFPVLGSPMAAPFRREHQTLTGAADGGHVHGSDGDTVPVLVRVEQHATGPTAYLRLPRAVAVGLTEVGWKLLLRLETDAGLYQQFLADPAGVALHSFPAWLGLVQGITALAPPGINVGELRVRVNDRFGQWAGAIEKMREDAERVDHH